jgi:hypothetical protein
MTTENRIENRTDFILFMSEVLFNPWAFWSVNVPASAMWQGLNQKPCQLFAIQYPNAVQEKRSVCRIDELDKSGQGVDFSGEVRVGGGYSGTPVSSGWAGSRGATRGPRQCSVTGATALYRFYFGNDSGVMCGFIT